MRISAGEERWSVELEDGGRFRVVRVAETAPLDAALGFRIMNGRATGCTLRHAQYALTEVRGLAGTDLAEQGREAVQRIADGRAR